MEQYPDVLTNWSLVANPVRDGHIFGVYTNIGYHYISPWATVLGFLLFGPRPRFLVRTVFAMLAIPAAWLVYTLLRGLLLTTPPPEAPVTQLGEPQHWYPYPFIDVNDPSPLIPGLEFGGYAGWP